MNSYFLLFIDRWRWRWKARRYLKQIETMRQRIAQLELMLSQRKDDAT